MSAIVDFYQGNPNPEVPFTWNQVMMDFTDEQWEACHNHIQWVFPLKNPSNYNPDAPLLTAEDIEILKNDKEVQFRLEALFLRFLGFLGLEYTLINEQPVVVKLRRFGIVFENKIYLWNMPNHNWQRITRCLASLKLLGRDDLAAVFFEQLTRMRQEGYGSENSFEYWKKAAEGLIE